MDLTVEWGQVHALLGENGAGKSTLMNVLYGLVQPDAGEVIYDGSPVSIRGPQDAIRLGIGMVHQHFMLIPPLTVAENVILGREVARGGGLIDMDAACRAVVELAAGHGLDVDPRARVEDLSVGEQQRVEIVKALYRGARLLALDEPTAVLTPRETEALFAILRSLTAAGNAIIFITHKLAEVMAIADRITVMRRGQVVAATTPAGSSTTDLARLMVGRPVLLRVDKQPAHPEAPVLRLENVSVLNDRHQSAVDGVDLEVRAGEIVGLAGVEGNGQGELVEALAGLRAFRGGRMELVGRDVTHSTAKQRLDGGLGYVPADRQRMGVILELPIADNLVLSDFDRAPFARGILRLFDAVRTYARDLLRTFDIRADSEDQACGTLSGGNQQKVVLARELGGHPRVLVAAQPTRGVDVGSVEFIHKQIVAQRDAGLGVLLVSSELDEILSLADRVAVMYRGRIVRLLDSRQIDREHIGLLMAGAA